MMKDPRQSVSLACIFLTGIGMSGCASYSNKFDCPYGEGLGCASVSKVNKMIDANMVDTQDHILLTPSSSIPIYFGPHRPSQTMTFQGVPVL